MTKRHPALTILTALCLVLLFAGAALAENVDDILRQRARLVEAWKQSELGVANVTLTKDPAEAYGLYEPRGNSTFAPPDLINVYAEVLGYTMRQSGDEYSFKLAADLTVLDDKDNVLSQQKKFWDEETRRRAFITESMVSFTLNTQGMPAGKYKLIYTLNDEYGAKTVSFEVPVTIQ